MMIASTTLFPQAMRQTLVLITAPEVANAMPVPAFDF